MFKQLVKADQEECDYEGCLELAVVDVGPGKYCKIHIKEVKGYYKKKVVKNLKEQIISFDLDEELDKKKQEEITKILKEAKAKNIEFKEKEE